MDLGEPDEVDDGPPFRTPPPADDRLWRHPSELPWSAATVAPPAGGRLVWPLALLAGVVGAALSVGLLAVTGAFDDSGPRHVVVREAVLPAVASTAAPADPAPPAHDVVSVVRRVEPAVVRIDVDAEHHISCSGVIFQDDGHVLTSAHAVAGGSTLQAVLADGRRVGATLVGIDEASDVAVVALEGEGPFPIATLGSTDALAVGQVAIAMGSRRTGGASSVTTTGIVSAIGRQLETKNGLVLADMIQTDAPVPSGGAGGALLDADGAVVGIITSWADDDAGSAGLGFATPIDVAHAVAEDLMALGHVRVVWVGVRGTDDEAGVVVSSVMTGSPAALAGLRPGDVILDVGGRPVRSMSALRVALRRRHPGERVYVNYTRAGKDHRAVVLLSERPPS